MMQEAHEQGKRIRKTIDMDVELAKSIEEMAEKRIWSFSQMAYVLLQQAVKEVDRQRKKNVSKKISS